MSMTKAEVDTEFIAAHLADPSVVLVEVDVSPAAYESGHIPGSVLWNAYTDLRQPGYQTVSPEELGALVQRSGIGADTMVVTYGYAAHLGYWLLRSCGHDGVRLMDGSRDQWTDAGHAWSSDVPAPATSQYELPQQDRFLASRRDVLETIADPSGIVLDVRADGEYDGAQFWPSGAPESVGRPGHVPGAVHLAIDSLRTSDGRFRGESDLRRVLQDRGITPSSEIVTYCTIGNRAAQAWFALTILLGYENVRVYYGSWVEWGMDPDSPIEP